LQGRTRRHCGTTMAGIVLAIKGKKKLSEAELSNDTVYTIGRGQDNMLVLDDPDVSRHHAQIEHLGHQFYVVDLGSMNGTFLNGKRVWKKASLKDRDEIRLCKYSLFFVDDPLDYEEILEGPDGTETIPTAFKSPVR